MDVSSICVANTYTRLALFRPFFPPSYSPVSKTDLGEHGNRLTNIHALFLRETVANDSSLSCIPSPTHVHLCFCGWDNLEVDTYGTGTFFIHHISEPFLHTQHVGDFRRRVKSTYTKTR